MGRRQGRLCCEQAAQAAGEGHPAPGSLLGRAAAPGRAGRGVRAPAQPRLHRPAGCPTGPSESRCWLPEQLCPGWPSREQVQFAGQAVPPAWGLPRECGGLCWGRHARATSPQQLLPAASVHCAELPKRLSPGQHTAIVHLRLEAWRAAGCEPEDAEQEWAAAPQPETGVLPLGAGR